jgi:hypothetical protein
VKKYKKLKLFLKLFYIYIRNKLKSKKMEEVVYTGNLNVNAYQAGDFSEAEMAQVGAGQFPILVAQNGTFTKKYVTEAELAKFTHWDALEADKLAQKEIHGNLPIVWECGPDGMIATGLEHQVIETPAETPAE